MKTTFNTGFGLLLILMALGLMSCEKKETVEPEQTTAEAVAGKPEDYFIALNWVLTSSGLENDPNGYTWTLNATPKDPKSGLQPVKNLRIYRLDLATFFSYNTGASIPGAKVFEIFNKVR